MTSGVVLEMFLWRFVHVWMGLFQDSLFAPWSGSTTSTPRTTLCDAPLRTPSRLGVSLRWTPQCVGPISLTIVLREASKAACLLRAASACFVSAVGGRYDLNATYNSVWCIPSTTQVVQRIAVVPPSIHQRSLPSRLCARGASKACLAVAASACFVARQSGSTDLVCTRDSA